MGTTSQDLTWIELQTGGWTREGPRGTRAMFNQAHRLLLYDENEGNVVFDPTTGDLPVLDTQDGVFQYDCPANCWLLKYLVIDRDQILDDINFRYEDLVLKSMEYYRILNIDARQSRLDQLATLMFVGVNPGTTHGVFKQMYYRTPTEILSDNIQHEMPGTTDEDFLIPATIKLIEGIDHGNIIEARQYIEMELKPQFQLRADQGEHGVPKFCIKRPF